MGYIIVLIVYVIGVILTYAYFMKYMAPKYITIPYKHFIKDSLIWFYHLAIFSYLMFTVYLNNKKK